MLYDIYIPQATKVRYLQADGMRRTWEWKLTQRHTHGMFDVSSQFEQ